MKFNQNLKVDIEKPFTIYLSRDKQLRKEEQTSVVHLYSEIKEIKKEDYELNIVAEENGKECLITYDITGKKMTFTRKGTVKVTFLASTNKEGAKIYKIMVLKKCKNCKKT